MLPLAWTLEKPWFLPFDTFARLQYYPPQRDMRGLAICITGMHRSGTSMVAKMLRDCGLELGPESEMVPAHPSNPEGHWENRRLMTLSERLLQSLGGGWDVLPITPDDWTALPNWSELKAQAAEATASFNGTTWGWKDPRVSVLIRFWLAAVPDLRVIICLRNPLDVADSLLRRGYSSMVFGLNLWKQYNLRLMSAVPADRRLITHYDAYFAQPEAELRRVTQWASLAPSDEQLKGAVSVLRTDLRHGRSTVDDLIAATPDRALAGLYLKMCAEAGPVYDALRPAGEASVALPVPSGAFADADCDASGLREKLSAASQEREVWHREAVLVQRQLEQTQKELQQQELALRHSSAQYRIAQAHIEAMMKTRAWRCGEFVTKLIATIRPKPKSAEEPVSSQSQVASAPIARSAATSNKTGTPVATLPSNPSYLANQVWIVFRAQGPLGVWQAWLKRRQMIKMLRDMPPDEALVARAEPNVSIVIPVYNNLKLTRQCVESILRNSGDVSLEIIIVDNASSDGTQEHFNAQADVDKRIRYYRNATNAGFGMAVNQGANHACGRFIVVANNDLIMTPGWLRPLLDVAESDARIGVVSPVSNFVGESPQMLQEFVHATDRSADEVAAELARRALPVREVSDRLVFFCVMVRRNIWHLVGGLSSAYGKGNYEDDDFCIRARIMGYRLMICQRSFVYHYGSQTFVKQAIPHELLMATNRRVFQDRLADFAQLSMPDRAPKPLLTGQPLFSLIIRTVDRPALLGAALRTLTAQLCNNFEVIVVNDGGPDATPVIEPFASSLRVRQVRHQPARGRSAAWNTGIREAKGRFICQLDDDDIVYPNHFAVFADAIEANPSSKVFYADSTRALYENRDGEAVFMQRLPMHVCETPVTELMVQDVMPIMTFAVARECYHEIGMVNESLEFHEDWDVLLRLSSRHEFHHIRRTTSEYRFWFTRRGMDNATLQKREESLRGLLATYERYPCRLAGIQEKRNYLVTVLKQQLADLEKVAASDASDWEKALTSVCLVAGFDPQSFGLTQAADPSPA